MTIKVTGKGEGGGRSGEKLIESAGRITHFSFGLCTAGLFFSAWAQTEACLCYLKNDHKTERNGTVVDSEV